VSYSETIFTPLVSMSFSVLSEHQRKSIHLLLARWRNARDGIVLSASNKWIIPSVPIRLSVLSENEIKPSLLQPRSSNVRHVFDWSASHNVLTYSLPSLPVFSENE
jgi:hypothetical protein